MDREQPLASATLFARLDRAAGDEDQPVTFDVDHAPAGAAQARINAQDADGLSESARRTWGSDSLEQAISPADNVSYPSNEAPIDAPSPLAGEQLC